jgi:regulatory protein
VTDKDCLQQCLDAAYRLLSYRPRSESEVRSLLRRRGFPPQVIAQALARLGEQKLIDDLAFARFWKDNRLSFRPRSKRTIEKELRTKQVAEEIIAEITQDIDDEKVAYELGLRRMSALWNLDYDHFCRRLTNYLAYRGFSHGTVRHTVSLLWQEKQRRDKNTSPSQRSNASD